MNLYDITKEFEQFESMDWDKESEVYLTTLESMQMTLQDKGQNIVSLLANWQGKADMIDAEIKRLSAKKTALMNQHKQLKEWLRFNMESSGIDKIECPFFTITLRKASKNTVLVIDDESEVIKHYEKPVKPAIDSVRLKADLKSGQAVYGAHLEDSKRGLMIK